DVIVLVGRAVHGENPALIWAIWPDHTVQLLADDIAYPAVSIGGDTIHVAGTQTGVPNQKPLVLRRYKAGQPVQTIAMSPQLSGGGSPPRLVTTAEGAAIVSQNAGVTWIAPSPSLTATSVAAMYDLVGGARRDETVVMASSTSAGTQGAVFAY